MSYEKPELVTLSIAAGGVRGQSDGDWTLDFKSRANPEVYFGGDDAGHVDGLAAHTSTTTAAYEADE